MRTLEQILSNLNAEQKQTVINILDGNIFETAERSWMGTNKQWFSARYNGYRYKGEINHKFSLLLGKLGLKGSKNHKKCEEIVYYKVNNEVAELYFHENLRLTDSIAK